MRSELNNKNKIQIRTGRIVHDSYLFFPRELGDLLLEPGDEIILIARNKFNYRPDLDTEIFLDNRKGIFNKIRKHLITEQAIHRLSNRKFNSFDCLKEAITKYTRRNKQ